MGISPFDEGVAAATSGLTEKDNPYEPGSDHHAQWEAGFLSGSDYDDGVEGGADNTHKI